MTRVIRIFLILTCDESGSNLWHNGLSSSSSPASAWYSSWISTSSISSPSCSSLWRTFPWTGRSWSYQQFQHSIRCVVACEYVYKRFNQQLHKVLLKANIVCEINYFLLLYKTDKKNFNVNLFLSFIMGDLFHWRWFVTNILYFRIPWNTAEVARIPIWSWNETTSSWRWQCQGWSQGELGAQGALGGVS